MPERSPTSPKRRWSRPALYAMAVVFAAATILYTTLWMLSNRWVPDVELGFSNSPALVVTAVPQDSPADKAGLRPGDRILAIDGVPLEGAKSLYGLYKPHKPGDTVHLNIARPGQTSPIILTAVFRQRLSQFKERGWTGSLAKLLRNSYPLPFAVVSLVVLFLRVENRRVWHLALLFASFAPGPGGIEFAAVPAGLLPFAVAYQVIFQGALAPLFYWFFAVFPVRSPLDRRLPWLKWASLTTIPIGTLSLALPGLRVPGVRLSPLANVFGAKSQLEAIFVACTLGFVALGLVSLASNFFGTTDPEARRKIRVIFWGTTIAFAPILVVATSHFFVEYQDPGWLDVAVILIASLFPLSFVYAVVKHRVLDIPVLLKRSARYLFVKQGFVLITAVAINAAILLFLAALTRFYGVPFNSVLTVGVVVGVVLGAIAVRASSYILGRITRKIDRAFFRSAYDARVILEDLAEKTRASTDRGELARLLEHHLQEALKPSSLAVYLKGSNDVLAAMSDAVPAELRTISASLPILAEAAHRGQPWELPPAGEDGAASSGLELLYPECLVPVTGRGGDLAGLVVLGPRLSEEPYSDDDKRLLGSIAAQTGTALENIRLAGEIADRIDAERRVAREMEIAREVQTRLLPQEPPRLKTLDCAAQCIEARSVGGDYYDFLDLGPDHVGFVLADVSGKGVHAALLVANLQAYLRSQSSIAPLDPARLLQQVNRMLWKATGSEHFATLFFAIYDDDTRQMSYVNCGHNPALWLRQDGSLQRLAATATVIGLFEQWECSVEQIRLAPGDLLVVFSDGVTEAARNQEEYGEAHLIHELQRCRHLPVNETVQTIFTSVQQFSAGAQSDDLTLLIAKARA